MICGSGLKHCHTLRDRAQRCAPLPSPVSPRTGDGQNGLPQICREQRPNAGHLIQLRLQVLMGYIKCTAFCSAPADNLAVYWGTRLSFASCPCHFDLWHDDVRSRTISPKPLPVRGFCRFFSSGCACRATYGRLPVHSVNTCSGKVRGSSVSQLVRRIGNQLASAGK